MVDIKNTRLLPSANFEPIDEGVLLTIIDPVSGQVTERKAYEDLNSALKHYQKLSVKVAKKIFEMENKEEKKED